MANTSDNKRVCGSLRSPKPLRASHTRIPLAEIPHAALGIFKNKKKSY